MKLTEKRFFAFLVSHFVGAKSKILNLNLSFWREEKYTHISVHLSSIKSKLIQRVKFLVFFCRRVSMFYQNDKQTTIHFGIGPFWFAHFVVRSSSFLSSLPTDRRKSAHCVQFSYQLFIFFVFMGFFVRFQSPFSLFLTVFEMSVRSFSTEIDAETIKTRRRRHSMEVVYHFICSILLPK